MKFTKLLCFIIITTLSVTQISAFVFEPLVKTYSPDGVESGQYFKSFNITNNTIRLQVSIYHLKIDKYGVEKRVESTEDFFIYPSDFSLNTKEEKSIRVQYNGDHHIIKEKVYNIVINQIPIEFNQEATDSSPEVLLSYTGVIYVKPKSVYNDVLISNIEKFGSDMRLNIENRGSVHTIMKNAYLYIVSDTTQKKININDIPGLYSAKILAGGVREVTFPWPDGIALSSVSGRLEYIEAD